jgi:hypothetical protein
MKALTSKAYFPMLILVGLACLPVAAHADSFTLDGAAVDSFSFGTAKTFTVEMATTDAAPYLTDVMLGTKIDLLTLDEFITADGTTTENVLEFADAVVKNYNYTSGSDKLLSDVTFAYEKVVVMENVGGNGGGNTVPEPSATALLASGLLALVGLGRKKLFHHGR